MILSGPGIRGQVVKDPVSAIHLVPTLADILKLPSATTWRGKSLAPVLRGEVEVPPAEPIFAQGTTCLLYTSDAADE